MESALRLFQLAALAGFLVLFLGRSVQLRLVHGVQPLSIGWGKPIAHALLEGTLLVLLPAFLLLIVAYAWPLPALQPPAWLDPVLLDAAPARWLGAALLAGGLALFAAALVSFGRSWRVGIDRSTPGALVTGGVFAWSRNPIFVFMDAYALGTFLLNGRLLFGVFAVATVVALHWQILQEERSLAGLHGPAYRDYLRRVPRYLGPPPRGTRGSRSSIRSANSSP